MSKPEVLELLKKDKYAPDKDAQRYVLEKKPSPCAKTTQSIHETLRRLQEQIEQIPIIDLSPILEKLERIETELIGFKDFFEKKQELLDTELRIARLFEAMLLKQNER